MIKQKSFFVFQTAIGFFFLLLGIFAFLAYFDMEYFIPLEIFSETFLEVVLVFIGIFFIRESVRHKDSGQRFIHLVVGLSLFFVGMFPLFVTLKILKFLPYYIDLTVSPLVLTFLIFVAAIYMILDRIFFIIS